MPLNPQASAAIGTSVFFAVAPGVVAGVMPWLLTGWEVGTPSAHWAVARVVGGLYRHVRNPMYLAVVGAIVGQALLLGRLGLLGYAALIAAAVVAFVYGYGYEQPTLAEQFGTEYDDYRRAVPAWLPRWHPWASPPREG